MEVTIVSNKTAQANELFKGMGGIGGILRKGHTTDELEEDEEVESDSNESQEEEKEKKKVVEIPKLEEVKEVQPERKRPKLKLGSAMFVPTVKLLDEAKPIIETPVSWEDSFSKPGSTPVPVMVFKP